MYYGTDFYLIRQLELRDIRLVYAPPDAIGNYGDEIDNFMWPRHTGDFTLLRAYVGKDGKPADYAPDNVPYAPPAHLQVSTRNVQAGRLRDARRLSGHDVPPPHGVGIRRTRSNGSCRRAWRCSTA